MSGLIDTSKFKQIQDEIKAASRTNPDVGRIASQARIHLIGDQLKEAQTGGFTLQCDEAQERRGTGIAPSPLQYLAAAIGFEMVSQLTRYASEFDVQIDRAELDVRCEYDAGGKLMIDEVSPAAQHVTYRWEISSPSPPETVREVVEWIDRGSHTLNTLRQPIPIVDQAALNGEPIDFDVTPFNRGEGA